MMFETTIAGSLPKPSWLAEPNRLWAPWQLAGTALRGKTRCDAARPQGAGGRRRRHRQRRRAVAPALRARLPGAGGRHRLRSPRRDGHPRRPVRAMVPTVAGPLRLRDRVHATEARLARAHTRRRLKFTLPGPMTIVDTIADAHYGDRVGMAMAFAELLNQEARALEADGVDVIQFDEPAFNVYMDAVRDWGIDALHRAIEGLSCTTAVHICYGYGIQANIDWKALAGRRVAPVRGDLPGARRQPDRPGLGRVPRIARAGGLLSLLKGKDVLVGVIDVATDASRRPRRWPTRSARPWSSCPGNGSSRAPTAAWRRCAGTWLKPSWLHWAPVRTWHASG